MTRQTCLARILHRLAKNIFPGWFKGFLLGLLVVLPILPLFAQDPSVPLALGPIESVSLRSFVVLCSDTIESSWAASLIYSLGKLERVREVYLWPEPVPQSTAPKVLAEALRWASLKDMGFVLYVTRTAPGKPESEVASREGSFDIHYRVFRVLSAQEIMAASFTADLPTEEELRSTFWLPLVAAMDTLEAQRRAGRLTIRGVPGSKLFGFTKAPIQLDNTGEATITVEIPGTYRYRAFASGYEARSGVLTLLDSPSVLQLEQPAQSPWYFESGALMGQFGDVWIHRHIGNSIWLGLGFQQYWIGLYFPNQEDLKYTSNYTNYFVSLPLLEPGIQAGYYLSDGLSIIKPYVSGTLFLRVNTSLLQLDPVAFMAISAQTGLEYTLLTKLRPFIELGFRFYPFCDGLYLAASRGGEVRAPSTFLFSDSWYVDIPILRLGVRFNL
ncbi:hypothetical protein [Gracilinema caldarium]|uniref:Uncharacterized protein n=1 Tax=Gracilinema caldarium (strain ATCC 51460 / DSM 7334 / H1) TaxID=744872 RepID=F8EXC6_GRAC1|nr:hypothetical protein [Gracilinema caldarium]AEJ19153.1 hypothetical protein Spica_1003 [Gracilinema caldarium DSM 7334]